MNPVLSGLAFVVHKAILFVVILVNLVIESIAELKLAHFTLPDNVTLKFPRHLGVIVGRRAFDNTQIGRIFEWSICNGIQYLSVHVVSGTLSDAETLKLANDFAVTQCCTGRRIVLRTRTSHVHIVDGKVQEFKLERKSSLVSVCKGCNMNLSTDEVVVVLTGEEEAMQDICDCAQALCGTVKLGQLSPDAVDIQLLDTHMQNKSALYNGLPEVEMALQFLPMHRLGGFAPWHSRLTEFIQTGPIHRFSKSRFERCIYQFSHIEQRFGK
eukprot:c2709_g1_i1.p1 GENE.c2709_g1_i1~~c2709_g1_i1.p1  ORF type:complete len:301 (+),score=52.15 c2709_g1_i1:97-903(+)